MKYEKLANAITSGFMNRYGLNPVGLGITAGAGGAIIGAPKLISKGFSKAKSMDAMDYMNKARAEVAKSRQFADEAFEANKKIRSIKRNFQNATEFESNVRNLKTKNLTPEEFLESIGVYTFRQ